MAQDSAEMAATRSDIRGLGDGVHYGRPYAYHQQAARRNFLRAWAELQARVLVIFGEYDQFESRHGHRLIVDTVNRLRPGTARYVELAGVDHGYWIYPNTVEAYADSDRGIAVPELFLEPLLKWLKDDLGLQPM